MITAILGFLAKLGFKAIASYNNRVSADHELSVLTVKEQGDTDRLKSQLAATLKAREADIIMRAMSHNVFWVVWGLFAVPLGLWWALVMLDTMTPPELLSLGIPALPQTIVPYADQIFNNIFYSGAVVGITQIVSRAIARR